MLHFWGFPALFSFAWRSGHRRRKRVCVEFLAFGSMIEMERKRIRMEEIRFSLCLFHEPNYPEGFAFFLPVLRRSEK